MSPNREWETGSILPAVNSLSKSFTKSEKKIAEVLLSNPQEAIYYSVTDFAEKAGVGDTSIIRFCRKLGFKGYLSFKIALTQELSSSKQQGVTTLDEKITLDDDIPTMMHKLLNGYSVSLKETLSLLNASHIDEAVKYIRNSHKLVFYGAGSSGITALEAKYKFIRVGLNVDAFMDGHMQAMSASLLTGKDTAVAISYSGSAKDTVEALHIAKESGARTICITHHARSPITKYADVILLSGYKESPLQGGALATKIAQLYVVDILYTEYFRRNLESARTNKEKTAESISDKLF